MITKISEPSLKSNNYKIAIISLDVSFTLTCQMSQHHQKCRKNICSITNINFIISPFDSLTIDT